MTQVPLANHHRSVTHLFESLRQEPLIGRQTIFAWRWDNGSLQPIAERITTSQQRRAGRRTHWLNIELFKPRSVLRKLVDVWRLDVGPVKPDVFPTQVIGHNVNDMRAWRRLLGTRRADGRQSHNGETHRKSGGEKQITGKPKVALYQASLRLNKTNCLPQSN